MNAHACKRSLTHPLQTQIERTVRHTQDFSIDFIILLFHVLCISIVIGMFLCVETICAKKKYDNSRARPQIEFNFLGVTSNHQPMLS